MWARAGITNKDYMKLYNPTDTEVSITYKGTTKSISAGGSIEGLTPEFAGFWVKTHEFLVPIETKVEVEVKKPVEPVKEETEEEVVEEVKEKKTKAKK